VNIGNFYLLNKDTATAISWWEKAVAKQPANPKLNNTLASYYRHVGNFQKADYYDNLSMKSKK
jgi:Tfp pilus assembly protein PilF